jgi:hypothetical protein
MSFAGSALIANAIRGSAADRVAADVNRRSLSPVTVVSGMKISAD